MTESWSPAFPGQRPPFAPANEVALQHGAWSPRRVDPLAEEIRSRVLADPSTAYLLEPRWAPAVHAWARAEAQVQLLTEHLAAVGARSDDGVGNLSAKRVQTAYALLHKAEARALSGRKALGLDPSSAARLGRDKAAGAADAARVMAELRRMERDGGGTS